MIRSDMWNEFLNLPPDAQQQVAELIADLRRKSCCSSESASDASRDDDTDMQAWQDDADYFESIRSSLWQDKTYRQKYVAIRHRAVIDTDDDKFELFERISRQHAADVVFIAKVQRESQVVEVPSPEIGP
ncbi:MAG: hypothetical protein WD065_09980 [Planctomycetaceae bacterium]